MEREELQELIRAINQNKPTNILTVFFVKKPSASKMQSFQPQVSKEVQQDIIQLVFPYIEKQLESSTLVEYDPAGVMDGEVEYLDKNSIEQIGTFLDSINDENVFKEMSQLDIKKINFYCFKISYNGKTIYMFRQFSKMKKLRSGYVARFFQNELRAMDGDFLGIDETTDMILADDEIIVFNHISLERIFNYRDQYLNKTHEAMGQILQQGVISNLEQFNEDCCRDVRIMKRFTNIMTKGRLPLFFENYEKVPDIVKDLGLDITFDDDGKIEYKDKTQLYHIVTLMSDSYFESLIAKRKGIAKLEEDLK